MRRFLAMKRFFSSLLVLVLTTGLSFPFVPADGCDHACCEVVESCCSDAEQMRGCGMTDGDDNPAPVLFNSAPKPPKTRGADLKIFERAAVSFSKEVTSQHFDADGLSDEIRESAPIPLYHLYQSLLI